MNSFPARLLAWSDAHGRKDLPWQSTRDPYAVWVSEIMLQQTQVATAIPYYERFMRAFPDVIALADAADDEVMRHWAGLGYYSRARNLLTAARVVRDEHDGELPESLSALMALPGIGRSTAAAVLAIAFDKHQAILDGNCKRVYARHAGIEGWPGEKRIELQLWAIAEASTPTEHVGRYTQAIMDLGATLCTRSKPHCDACPVSGDCVALARNLVDRIPGARPRRERPVRSGTLMVVTNNRGEILLERRPPSGIWGGLWSLPLTEDEALEGERLPVLRHQFTHFVFDLQPVKIREEAYAGVRTGDTTAWVSLEDVGAYGLPAPVRRILEMLESGT